MNVVRLDALTVDQRRLVLALVAADKSAKERSPAMTMIAEPSIQSDMHSEYSGVQTTVEPIGPEQAKEMLNRNTHNRPVRHRVTDLAREMAEGRWVLNGESIKFAEDETLLDGQHRLHAIVESGQTISSVIVRGLPATSQETVDIGARRSLSDVLHLRGESNVASLAASLMVAWRLENNGHLFGGTGYAYPTSSELLSYLEANPGIRASVPLGYRVNASAIRYTPGSAIALHYLMSRLDPVQADEFWDLLSEGVGLMSGHPVLTLRKYFIRDLSAPRRMDQVNRVAITIKTWNAFRKNRSLQVIKWTRSGDKPEDFPTLV